MYIPDLDLQNALKCNGRAGSVLIVVPPFANHDCPSLAAHLLQACARERGFKVDVLYANLSWASAIGETEYAEVCRGAPYSELSGERMFRHAAFGLPLPSEQAVSDRSVASSELKMALDWRSYRLAAERAGTWADEVAQAIVAVGYRVVGCTITFEQTVASIALLDRIKSLDPTVVTVLGGGNCQGEMAEGLLSVARQVDYIFSGESEEAFPSFLAGLEKGVRPTSQIVAGSPCMDMDSLPTPDYSEFFDQRHRILPNSTVKDEALWLHCEGSRGCWWGQKHHCTFCGFNGVTMKFRERTPERLLEELKSLADAYPTKKFLMADNIMPHHYFTTFLPRLAEELPGLYVYYEVKSNLTLAKCWAFRRAGIRDVQAGVEALSTSLLRRMDKGVTGSQNIALLRYARSVGLQVSWNLLYDFPDDELENYEQTLDVIRLLHHLQPPVGFHPLSIDRFCPYFDRPGQYGIRKLEPMAGYAAVYPQGADLERIAYHFRGDYRSAARQRPEQIERINGALAEWRACWASRRPPTLAVKRLRDNVFLLIDQRGLPGTKPTCFLTPQQASVLLVPCNWSADQPCEWAVAHKLAVKMDGICVPLATAKPELIQEMEDEYRRLIRKNATAKDAAKSELPVIAT